MSEERSTAQEGPLKKVSIVTACVQDTHDPTAIRNQVAESLGYPVGERLYLLTSVGGSYSEEFPRLLEAFKLLREKEGVNVVLEHIVLLNHKGHECVACKVGTRVARDEAVRRMARECARYGFAPKVWIGKAGTYTSEVSMRPFDPTHLGISIPKGTTPTGLLSLCLTQG